MDSNFTIFIVDDVAQSRFILESALGKEWRFESFINAEDCLARLEQDKATAPDLFLLDVDLPGMDGFTLCRAIKRRPGLETVPVIFISGLDDLESRLDGFDAGGVDFMVKPCSLVELKQKIRAACRIQTAHQLLNSQLDASESLVSLVLSNLDEYAVLIGFLRTLNACEQPRAVVDALFEMLRSYQLHGAIQVRIPPHELTLSEHGQDHPLEVSIIKHVRELDRIFEFKQRAAFNFKYLTILINTMPLQDSERCGRLRDQVAIAAEYANSRLQTIQTKNENVRAKGGVAAVLERLKAVVNDFEAKYALARYQGSTLTLDMLNELTAAFSFLAISDEQERQILDVVCHKAEALADIYDFANQTQLALNDMSAQLTGILESSETQDT